MDFVKSRRLLDLDIECSDHAPIEVVLVNRDVNVSVGPPLMPIS